MPEQIIPETWDKAFNTGIDFIDEQHMYFFDILKKLEIVVREGSCRERASDIFFSLVHYVEHFRLLEEIYYKDRKLGNLKEHKQSHRDFVTGIIRFKDEFSRGEENVCRNLLDFLSGWFYAHILGTDRRNLLSC